MIRKPAEPDWIRGSQSDLPSHLATASAFLALFAATVYLLAAAHVASHSTDSSGTSASQPCAVCANVEPPVCVTAIAIAVAMPIMTSLGAFVRLQAFPSWRIEGASLPRAPPRQ